MLMKKCVVLLASFLLLFLYSCEKSEETPVKEYELVDIQFSPVEDGVQKADIEFEAVHAFNRTAVSVFLPFVVKREVDDEQSVFTMSQTLPKEIASRNDIYVDAPDIMEGHFVGRVLFSNAPQSKKRVFNCVNETMELPRSTEYSITCQIHGYKQTNEFTATFEEVYSGEIIEIKGKWSGVKYSYVESKAVLSELK